MCAQAYEFCVAIGLNKNNQMQFCGAVVYVCYGISSIQMTRDFQMNNIVVYLIAETTNTLSHSHTQVVNVMKKRHYQNTDTYIRYAVLANIPLYCPRVCSNLCIDNNTLNKYYYPMDEQ